MFVYRDDRFFLKWNNNASDLFYKESLGLRLLGDFRIIGVPEVISRGKTKMYDFLCIEYVEKGLSSAKYWRNMGEQLASLHLVSQNRFGLYFDNHIGKLHQCNAESSSWSDFFVQNRLMPQVKMADNSGFLDKDVLNAFERLYQKVHNLFPEEPPALMHGDLWSGNVMAGPYDKPYIFDPAVYYGHREAELAFTAMFGSFGDEFYRAYQERYPLAPGFESRTELYNLYPLLVHVNLFGLSYLSPIKQTLRRFA